MLSRRLPVLLCLLLPLLQTLSARPPASKYAADLEAFFEVIDRDYPFLDVKDIRKDWLRKKSELAKRVARCEADAEFVKILWEAMACLRDGHMSFTELDVKVDWPSEFFPGVSFLPATRNRVVVMTAATPNLKNVLPPGTVVTKIDGQPARRYLEARSVKAWREGGHFSSPQRARFFEYRLPLSGERGEKHKLHYLVGKRREKSVTLTSTYEVDRWPHHYLLPDDLVQGGKSVWYGRLEDEVGFIYLRRMDESVEPGIRAAIDGLPEVRGWIVDLRGNTGGGYSGSLKSLIRELARPVAGIIDGGCVSAGETFARDLVEICQARLFGATTAGSSSKKNVFELPSGLGKIRYSVASRRGVGGKPIEYHGVEPHEALEAIPELLHAGKNSELEQARRYLVEARRKK